MNATVPTALRGAPVFAEWRSELAPFVVVRTAGVSVDLVRRVLTPRLAAPVARACLARSVLDTHRQRLEDGLHAWVAALQQDRFRHRVLDSRRAVHNRRMPAGIDDDFLRRLSAFDSSLAFCFDKWRAAMQQWLDATAELNALEEELRSEHFARALVPLFADSAFSLGLSHSAPTIFRDRERYAKSGPVKGSRCLRFVNTMLSYLIRAGTKTSPLTTFMQWTSVPLDCEQPEDTLLLDGAKLAIVSALNRAPLIALRQALGLEAGLSAALRTCPTLEFCGANQIAFWAVSYVQREERTWRRDIFTRLRLAPHLIDLLKQWVNHCPSTFDLACSVLEQVVSDRAKAQSALDALVRKGVLILGPEPEPFAESLAPPLVEWAKVSGKQSLLAAANALGAAELDAREFSSACLTDRIRIGSAIVDAATAVAQTVGSPSTLTSAWLLLENSSWSNPRGKLGKPFYDMAQSVMAVIKRKLLISQQYIWLRDNFVQQYGRGGVCREPLAFFAAAAAAYPAGRDWRDSYANPQSADIDLSGWRIPICFQFQLDAAPGTNAPVPVVNAVYSRGIWIMGRYTANDAGTRLTEQARAWLERCAAPAEPVAVVFGTEASNLQIHGELTRRFIDCTSSRREPGRILLRDLVFRHDARSGLLVCEDREGRMLRPVYLGGSQTGQHFGAALFLILMGEPIVIMPPPARMLFNQSTQAEVVRHRARYTEDGCVLLRATWWIRTRVVMEALDSLPFAETVLWLNEFFEQQKIPKEGFVFGQTLDQWRAVGGEAAGFRKPMWYSLNDPWCLKRVLSICAEMDYLVIRESLPTLEHGASAVNGAQHVTEFHLEACIEAV